MSGSHVGAAMTECGQIKECGVRVTGWRGDSSAALSEISIH